MKFAERQREAGNELAELNKSHKQIIIIHYSCESFYDSESGRTPRITSIACRNYADGQTRSFSIHQVSELPEFSNDDPWDIYDKIEKSLLDDFFSYVRENRNHAFWVHWNMRDINYGFPAIEHRYRVLGGDPTEIPDERKIDLARLLVGLFGKRYAGHPRLTSIVKMNKITDRDFLNGEGEAAAFKNRDFLNLHRSTLRKVDVIASLFDLASQKRLKTSAPLWDKYGGSVRLFWEKYILTPLGVIGSAIVVLLGFVEWFYPDAKIVFANWIAGWM